MVSEYTVQWSGRPIGEIHPLRGEAFKFLPVPVSPDVRMTEHERHAARLKADFMVYDYARNATGQRPWYTAQGQAFRQYRHRVPHADYLTDDVVAGLIDGAIVLAHPSELVGYQQAMAALVQGHAEAARQQAKDTALERVR